MFYSPSVSAFLPHLLACHGVSVHPLALDTVQPLPVEGELQVVCICAPQVKKRCCQVIPI